MLNIFIFRYKIEFLSDLEICFDRGISWEVREYKLILYIEFLNENFLFILVVKLFL